VITIEHRHANRTFLTSASGFPAMTIEELP
jgi:hypothetical protein